MSIPVSEQSDPVLGRFYACAAMYGSIYEVIRVSEPLTLRHTWADGKTRLWEDGCGEVTEDPGGQEIECDLSYFRPEFSLVG